MSTADATPALITKIGAMHIQAVAGVNFTVGSEAGSTILVSMQAVDADSNDLKRVVTLPFYFSTDSAGQVLDSAMSTTPAINTDGMLIFTLTDLAGMLTFESDGDAAIDMVDTGTNTRYLVLVLPNGSLAISGAVTHT